MTKATVEIISAITIAIVLLCSSCGSAYATPVYRQGMMFTHAEGCRNGKGPKQDNIMGPLNCSDLGGTYDPDAKNESGSYTKTGYNGQLGRAAGQGDTKRQFKEMPKVIFDRAKQFSKIRVQKLPI